MRHVPSSLVISAVVAGALLVHLCIGSLSGPRLSARDRFSLPKDVEPNPGIIIFLRFILAFNK